MIINHFPLRAVKAPSCYITYKQLLIQLLLDIFLFRELKEKAEDLNGVREKGYTFVA